MSASNILRLSAVVGAGALASLAGCGTTNGGAGGGGGPGGAVMGGAEGARAGMATGTAGAAQGGAGVSGGAAGGGQVGNGGNGVETNQRYEAEDAFNWRATVVEARDGASGRGYVDGLWNEGATTTFAVNAASDGPRTLTLRARGASHRVTLSVNGTKLPDIELASAVDFADMPVTAPLRRGLNTVTFGNERMDYGDTPSSVDYLQVPDALPQPERGAIVPFVEYEAEDGETNATAIGPDTQIGSVAANASGRRAVTLDGAGKFVEWTLKAAGSGMSLRYSLPDAPAGGGSSGSVSLYVDGKKRQSLALSSKNAWVYDPYPFGNDPASGVASRAFSEDRFVVGDLPAGAKLRLQRDAEDGAAAVTIDLIDVEPIPEPYAQPAGSIAITEHGAVADDEADDASALLAAIGAAKAAKQVVWVPAGRFVLGSRVDVSDVTIRGAGPWHSVFRGKANRGGFNGTGGPVQLLDFAVFGDMDHRDDSYDAAVDGSFGTGSLIQNLWLQSTKVGIWMVQTHGAYVVGTRIRDTYADGVNLNVDVTGTAVDHVHVRNTGDDGLAIWSKGESAGNRFKWCSVHVPYHASAIAVYGGKDQRVEDCEVADTVRNGAGIQLGTRHDPTPLAGVTRVSRCDVARAGSLDAPNANWFGAVWLFADTKPIDAALELRDLNIAGSSFDAVHLTGKNPIAQPLFDNVHIDGAGKSAVHIETAGKGTFSAVTAKGAVSPSDVAPTFELTRGAGNDGW